MKIGAVAAGLAFMLMTLLAGCPKSNPMLDHANKPGAIQQGTGSGGSGELTTGTPPAGGTQTPPPPPAGNSGGDQGGSSGGDQGGGDSGGDDGGDEGG
jgi:hypothetical protein